MTGRQISLTADEALVLFELLHRWEGESTQMQLEPGEQEALWSLSCALERILTEPFDPRYEEMLTQARARLAAVTD